MKFNKAMLIDAIDAIVDDHEAKAIKWTEDVAKFNRQRLISWRRDEWPKWKKLQALIQSKTRTKGPITTEELAAIFPDRNSSAPRLHWHSADYEPRSGYELLDGETMYKPSDYPIPGMTLPDLKALRGALTTIVDETVSDAQLAKIGYKDLAPLFRRAVEAGGLVG